jgi:hypothetical protein
MQKPYPRSKDSSRPHPAAELDAAGQGAGAPVVPNRVIDL